MPNISFIIPTYNRLKCLELCLDSVFNQKKIKDVFDYEVLVALDCRDSQTKKWLNSQTKYSGIRLFKAMKNGVNPARNVGIENAKYEVVYFLDDDCLLPDSGWAIRVYNNFLKLNSASAIGGEYYSRDNEDTCNYCRNKVYNFFLKSNQLDNGQTLALLGGNAGYRKNVLLRHKGFNEKIIYGGTETELNKRIIRGNGKMYLCDDIFVEHAPVRRGIFSLLKSSFLQGLGSKYIQNGENVNFKREKLWFLKITSSLDCNFKTRVNSGIFLFLNSFAYHFGCIIGQIIKCYPGS